MMTCELEGKGLMLQARQIDTSDLEAVARVWCIGNR